ncbi:MAG: 16S rRNA (adenine(1518)-N(6)/adenine(1519)-N(6))-dimethyltransferase RsmA [bacterium]
MGELKYDRVRKISRLLSEHGLRLRKRLGQHFLVNPRALEAIVDRAAPASDELVVEVGAGIGNLTFLLRQRAGRVVSFELDENFRPLHEKFFSATPNVRVAYQDFLKADLAKLIAEEKFSKAKVVGNIPYSISSAILMHVLESGVRWAGVFLLMQKEVAERLAAPPGSKVYSLLTAKVNYFGVAEASVPISAKSFLPPPKVDSALVAIRLREKPRDLSDLERRELFRLLNAAFGQRRKQLVNALSASPHITLAKTAVEGALQRCDLSPKARAEDFGIEQFIAVYQTLKSHGAKF